MAFTSVFGIGFAALIGASVVLPRNPQPPHNPQLIERSGSIVVEIDKLRHRRGVVRLCLTSQSDDFPKCRRGAREGNIVMKDGTSRYTFHDVEPGIYAIAAFHDANGDGRLNTVLGIPSEGFAFSRNPALRAGAPRFIDASFPSRDSPVLRLSMRYLL